MIWSNASFLIGFCLGGLLMFVALIYLIGAGSNLIYRTRIVPTSDESR